MMLPINVMNSVNFSAKGNKAERLEGYKNFAKYFSAYNAGEKNVDGVSMEDAHSAMLKFYKSEVEFMSGKSLEDYDLAHFCTFPDVIHAAFSIIGMITDVPVIDTLNSSMGAFAEIKTVGIGDTLSIVTKPRDLLVVSKGGRAKRSYDIQRQYNSTKTIIPEPYVVSVAIPLYEVLSGNYTIAEFAGKAVRSLETTMSYEIYDAFAAALDTLQNSGDAKLRASGYTQDSIVEIAQRVSSWNGGNAPIFLGTKLALSKVLPSYTNIRADIDSDYVKVGHLIDFFGYKCVELNQIADYTTEFKTKIADNRIYVLSTGRDKIVKVAMGGTLANNAGGIYDNADLTVTADLVKYFACGVATGSVAGLIELA